MNANEIPLEWQQKPHIEVMVCWLGRQPRVRSAVEQRIDEEMEDPDTRELFQAQLERNQQELPEYPGWYFHFKVSPGEMVPTLEQARQNARDRVRIWNLSRPGFVFMEPLEAPVWLSKSERRKLLLELDAAPNLPAPEGEEQYVFRFIKPLGEYALLIELLDAPFAEDFETVTGAPNDPIRSLIGVVCTLSSTPALELENAESDDDEDPWRDLASGVVSYQGGVLRVGEYSLEVAANLDVSGTGFEQAYWLDSVSNLGYELHRVQEKGDD